MPRSVLVLAREALVQTSYKGKISGTEFGPEHYSGALVQTPLLDASGPSIGGVEAKGWPPSQSAD